MATIKQLFIVSLYLKKKVKVMSLGTGYTNVHNRCPNDVSMTIY